ncbi:MAG TPA: histidine kinase [Glycomyces sp.]|nr:histidine kinase [Glycomyces sp.]
MLTRPKPMLPHATAVVLIIGALTVLALFTGTPAGPLDVAVAALSVAAALTQLWRPVAGTLAATVLAAFSPIATAAATAGVLHVAQRRRLPLAAALAGLGAAAHAVQGLVHPNPAISYEWWLILDVAAYGALLGWGALARSRRELLLSLRERAHRAEAEQGRRVAEAREAERRELAREMHDVLAHRLSLVSTYAGALEYRPDAPPEQLAAAAGIVRRGVHEALDELRQVIGLLREHDAADDEGLVPTLADLPRLLGEARRVGQTIRLDDERAEAAVPVSIGRTAFRILQEGLTNARKHAPGLPVDVALRGEPGKRLLIELRNPLPPRPAEDANGSGLGLVGLTERVRLAGGELDHGAADGGFRLRARLPWPA